MVYIFLSDLFIIYLSFNGCYIFISYTNKVILQVSYSEHSVRPCLVVHIRQSPYMYIANFYKPLHSSVYRKVHSSTNI